LDDTAGAPGGGIPGSHKRAELPAGEDPVCWSGSSVGRGCGRRVDCKQKSPSWGVVERIAGRFCCGATPV
jgi:hypothetical protein